MASMVLMGIGIAGMAGSLISSGVEAGMNEQDIRNNINNVKGRTADLKNKFDQVISAADTLTAEMVTDMTSCLDELSSLQAQLKVSQDEFLTIKNKIETTGIYFVIGIFFLLLLKGTGFLESIDQLLVSLLFPKNTK